MKIETAPPVAQAAGPNATMVTFRAYDAKLSVHFKDDGWQAIFGVPKAGKSHVMDESTPKDWRAKRTKHDNNKPIDRVRDDFATTWREYLAQEFMWQAYRHSYPPDYENPSEPWPPLEDFVIDWSRGSGGRFGSRAKASVGGDDNPGWSANSGDDRVYLVDTDNRPIVYGDDASPTPATFLWPRAEAQAAIGTAYVRDPGYDLPAAQIMDPEHYTVVWANRHGRNAWWLVPKGGRTAAADTSKCPECGRDLQWGRHPGEAGRFGEELGFCPYCEWKGTEDDMRTEASVETDEALTQRYMQAIEDARADLARWGHVEQLHRDQIFSIEEEFKRRGLPKPGWPKAASMVALALMRGSTLVVDEQTGATSIRPEALGEKKAPPKVDTLRDEACPVCAETDAYQGTDCGVCGFVKPPDAFMDPDVEKAQQLDLRQDQQEAGTAPVPADAQGLQCDNCGASFGGQGEATAPGTAKPAAPTAGSGLERFKVGAKTAVLPDTTQDGDAVDEDPTATAPKAGDACPECGEGTLHPVQGAPSPDEGTPTPAVPAPAEQAVEGEQEAPAADGEGDEQAPEAPKPDEDNPATRDDSEDEDDEEADPNAPKDSSKGKKESAMRPTLRRLAEQQIMIETAFEGIDAIASIAGIDLTPVKTNASRRLASLQARAADIPDGSVGDEDRAVFEVVASTRTADAKNPAQPEPEPSPGAPAPEMTTEKAKTPSATEDVTSPMGEVATEGVTPDANTSLQSADTVLDQPLDLNEVDVTTPVTGTTENEGAHKVEHDISSRVDNPPENGPMFPLDGGPFAQPAKVTGSVEQPAAAAPEAPAIQPEAAAQPPAPEAPAAPAASEARTFACLRLARLRMQAGIVPAQDDLVLASAMAKDASLTDEKIADETATLDKVVATAAQRTQQQAPVSRSLVPRAAAATAQPVPERAVPSLVTAAAANASPVAGPSVAVTADEVDALW